MATKKQDAAINLYAKLMEEAKSRLACVSLAVNGKTGLPGPAVREFCFLQFRMICELISLGCLTAHGDIQATTRLRDEWSAKNILSQLEKLHPDFYPFPSEKETDGRNHHLTPITEGFLTKADLLNLNGKCGDILHRGSLKKLLSPNSPVQVHFPDIDGWAKKIARLLDIHSIALLGGEAYIVCLMSSNENGGRVQVAIAEVSTNNGIVGKRLTYWCGPGPGPALSVGLPYARSRASIPRMPELTRRRSADHRHKCWHIYYGDVHVGTIAERSGNPHDTDPWEWCCGFYPGSACAVDPLSRGVFLF